MKAKRNNNEDGTWWAFGLNIKLPHEGFGFSYDFYAPTQIENWCTAMLRLGFVTLIYEWGYDEDYE
jgi:hypothetical protein